MSIPTNDQQAAGGTPALLITSNFSNNTGFAWKAFFRLFNHVARAARERGIGLALSFAEVDATVEILDPDIPRDVFTFDPLNITVSGLWALLRNVRRLGIRHAYLTDLPSWHWLYLVLRLWGVERIVVHSHISVPDPYAASPETGFRRLIKVAIHRGKWLSADEVFTCSRFVADRLVRKACFPAGRITVINYGLPESRFLSPEVTSGSTPESRMILCTGRATKYKGVQHLIEATRQLLERHGLSNFVVRFAGDGPDLDAFKEQVRECGIQSHFQFLECVGDTVALLRAADIVVIPSSWGDAFPYTVLEAMAAGRAIVATRVGGIPEQIGEGEDCGILVAPGDPAVLADALSSLLCDEDLRTRLAAKAAQRARIRFREDDYFRAVTQELFRALRLGGPAQTRTEPSGRTP